MSSKKVRPGSPLCTVHFSERGTPRQRHTCFLCMSEDLSVLRSNPYLTRWDIAWAMTTISRSYPCSLCFFTKPSVQFIRKAGDCREHSVYNSFHRCHAHRLRWTECVECLYDVRAATSMCKFCGKKYSGACDCPRGPGKIRDAVAALCSPQPGEQIRLKELLEARVLEYARRLQACEGDLERQFQIRSSFAFPDCAGLRTVLELQDSTCAERFEAVRAARVPRAWTPSPPPSQIEIEAQLLLSLRKRRKPEKGFFDSFLDGDGQARPVSQVD